MNMDSAEQILKNSALLNSLDEKIDETFKIRDQSQERKEKWEAACTNFHESFEKLFFPGGEENLKQALAGESRAVEAAIEFLVADPIHFRSGYVKEELWHKVPNWDLSKNQIEKIENAALAYILRKIRRDFWYMCKAMARVATPIFWDKVYLLISNEDNLVSKRASYLLSFRNGIEAGQRMRKKVSREILLSKYG